jgi:hypothetical protein
MKVKKKVKMSVPYNYQVYQDITGKTFVDTLINRNTYYVVDPGKTASQLTWYQNKTATSVPTIYATAITTVPSSTTSNASYVISLYSGVTKGPVSCVTVTPSEMRVAQDLSVNNDLYIGYQKNWRLHHDSLTNHLMLQTKDTSGTYVTQFQIISSV